jgi:membrane protease YdiL (CAAX protease family)
MPRGYQIPLMLSALMLLVSGTMLVSLVFAGNSSLEEGFTLYNTFVSRNNGGFWSSIYLIIAYAVIPALCEETVFRAVLCREYEKYNVICGVIASSVFFALLHFNVYQFPVYLFSGIMLALVMYATGSVVASIIVHMVFNVFGLFGQPYLNAFYAITGGTEGLFLFILCMLTIFFAALFCTFAAKCYSKRAKNSNSPDRKLLPSMREATYIASEIFFTPFSIAAICLYIVVLIIGLLK